MQASLFNSTLSWMPARLLAGTYNLFEEVLRKYLEDSMLSLFQHEGDPNFLYVKNKKKGGKRKEVRYLF